MSVFRSVLAAPLVFLESAAACCRRLFYRVCPPRYHDLWRLVIDFHGRGVLDPATGRLVGAADGVRMEVSVVGNGSWEYRLVPTKNQHSGDYAAVSLIAYPRLAAPSRGRRKLDICRADPSPPATRPEPDPG